MKTVFENFIKTLIPLCLLAVSHLALAENVVFDTSYELNWNGTKIGIVKRKLINNGGTYTFTSIAKPRGLARLLTKGINEKSVFRMNGEKIAPLEYFFEHRGKDSKTIVHKYYWGQRTLEVLRPDNITVKNIKPNAMDILNFQYFIMRGLARGENKFAMTMYKKPLAPNDYLLQTAGIEQVATKAGSFSTVRVSRVGGKSRFDLWCAPKLNYLPVKIHLVDRKGKNFIMTLTKVRSY